MLGDMGVLVRGFLVEGGEGDGGDNNFDAVAPLRLQLFFDLLTAGTTGLTLDWQLVVALPTRRFRGCARGGTLGSR